MTGLARVWRQSTAKVDTMETKVKRHRERWDHVTKATIFMEWREALRRLQVADEFYIDTLLNRLI